MLHYQPHHHDHHTEDPDQSLSVDRPPPNCSGRDQRGEVAVAPSGPLRPLSSSSSRVGGGGSEAKIVLTTNSGLVFVIVTCSFCIPLFIAGIVMTAASLSNGTGALYDVHTRCVASYILRYRTGVSLLAVSVGMAVTGIVLVVLICTGACAKKSVHGIPGQRLVSGFQQGGFGMTVSGPLFGRFLLRPRAAASHEAAVLCLPPPYSSIPASRSLIRDEASIAVPLGCPQEAWPATEVTDPGLHLPPYSQHPSMSSYGAMPGVLPMVAWDADPKLDHPPTYDESCRDTTVIHM